MNTNNRELPNVAIGSTYFTEYVNGLRVIRDWQNMIATVTLDNWKIICPLTNQAKIDKAVFELIDRRAAFFANAKDRSC